MRSAASLRFDPVCSQASPLPLLAEVVSRSSRASSLRFISVIMGVEFSLSLVKSSAVISHLRQSQSLFLCRHPSKVFCVPVFSTGILPRLFSVQSDALVRACPGTSSHVFNLSVLFHFCPRIAQDQRPQRKPRDPEGLETGIMPRRTAARVCRIRDSGAGPRTGRPKIPGLGNLETGAWSLEPGRLEPGRLGSTSASQKIGDDRLSLRNSLRD